MPPMAAVVAAEEPEIAAKNAQETMATREMPPVTQPTRESANSTSFLDRAARRHNVTGQEKAGNCQHGKVIRAAEQLLSDNCKGDARVDGNRHNRGNSQCPGNGKADYHAQQEYHNQDYRSKLRQRFQNHLSASFSAARFITASFSRRRYTNSTSTARMEKKNPMAMIRYMYCMGSFSAALFWKVPTGIIKQAE